MEMTRRRADAAGRRDAAGPGARPRAGGVVEAVAAQRRRRPARLLHVRRAARPGRDDRSRGLGAAAAGAGDRPRRAGLRAAPPHRGRAAGRRVGRADRRAGERGARGRRDDPDGRAGGGDPVRRGGGASPASAWRTGADRRARPSSPPAIRAARSSSCSTRRRRRRATLVERWRGAAGARGLREQGRRGHRRAAPPARGRRRACRCPWDRRGPQRHHGGRARPRRDPRRPPRRRRRPRRRRAVVPVQRAVGARPDGRAAEAAATSSRWRRCSRPTGCAAAGRHRPSPSAGSPPSRG